jgi:hypothetical protein
MKASSLKYLLFACCLFFITSVKAQVNQQTSEDAIDTSIKTATATDDVSTKTVEYKIHNRNKNSDISEKTATDIDNLLMSKKGINSSKTNIQTGIIKVNMNQNCSEKAVEQLFERLDVEVETGVIID